jgi:anti-sigma regulatory factor (Ser/Thr protein kinase)
VSGILVYLPARPTSAREARDRLKPLLRSWRSQAARDNATLVLSEIVTNAVRHASGGPILITVTTMDGHLRVEVHDESASLPIARTSGETGGYGLRLIDRLSDQWGIHQHPGDGKTVWFEMGDADPTDRTEPEDAVDPP